MTAPQDFAAQFARTLDLFRDPGAKEEQKAEFRALVILLKKEGLTLATAGGAGGGAGAGGRPMVNGTGMSGAPQIDAPSQRLAFHSVSVLTILAPPPPT